MRILFTVGMVFVLSSCGTSKSIMTKRYQGMETWQICKKMLENRMPGFRQPWANDVLQKRGENCDKYIGKFQPVPKVKNTTSPVVCTKTGYTVVCY